MTDCVGKLELVRWESTPDGARSQSISAHVRNCERCASALGELIAAREELLGPDPLAQSLAASRSILAMMEDRRRKTWWRFVVPLTLTPVAATAMVLLVVALRVAPQSPTENPKISAATTGSAGGVRSKGTLIVEAFCKRGDRVFPVKDGDDFLAGDRLRFAYTKDQPGVLLVFGVDDAGRIFPYYRDDALVGVNAPPGGAVMLPESVELDDHRGWERVFSLWTPAPLGEDTIRAAVAEAMAAVGGDIRQTSHLSVAAEQVTFLLRRP
jgi:hypothetical protein